MAYKTINPYINELVATFAALRTDELEHAVTHAQATYPHGHAPISPNEATSFNTRRNCCAHRPTIPPD